MEIISNIAWFISALAIIGVVLNIKKKRSCFYFWAFTNFSWIIIDAWFELYAQAALFAVYFVLAIWGIFAWRDK